jgi:hypothetical protein
MESPYTDRVIERAQRDDSFRQQLLDDPRAAISDELGVEIPDNLQIRVIEKDPQEVVLVLPAPTRAGELTDEQLAGVAAGGDSLFGWGCPDYTKGGVTCAVC